MRALSDLAQACNDGACNVRAILVSLGEAVREYPDGNGALLCDPALKCIIGQVSFLLGESAGPTESALAAFMQPREGAGERG